MYFFSFLIYSVSSALDEAATALNRMKSEKKTYEAFLHGASQPPMQASAAAALLAMQHQKPPSSPTSSVAMPTNTPSSSYPDGTKAGGGAEAVVAPKGLQPQAKQNSQPASTETMQSVQRLLSQGTWECAC